MYQGSNLSRTAQLALNNNESDQINNQLKLLKQKMSSRDTWQSKPLGNDVDVLDSYKQQPFTQPLPQKQFQSQSPLYPRNEFESYSKPPAYQTKQEAFKSQPQLPQQQDPRQMNFHQMQQYKAQYVMNNNAARSQEPIGTKILENQYSNYQTSQKPNTYNVNQNIYNNGNHNYPNNTYNNNLNSYNNNNYNYNANSNQNYQNNQQNNYYQNNKYQDNNNYNYNYNKIQDSYLNKQNQQLIQQPKQPSQLFSNNTQSTNYSNNNYSGDPYLKNTYKDDQQKKYQLYQQQANSVMQQQINYKQQQQPVFPQEGNIPNQNPYNSLKYINQNNMNLNQKQPTQQQQQPPSQPQKFYERLQQDETLLKRQQQLQQPFKNEEPQPLRKNINHQQQQQQQYQQPNPSYSNAIDDMPAFVSKNKQPQIPLENDDGARLIECPEGCGRSFKEEALQKHVKVCQKVFQSKRKEFNSKEARQVTNEQAKLEKQGLAKDKIIQQKKKAKGDPKWKKQSEQFRQMIAAARNGDVVAEQVNDDYVDCPGCGRKFNQNAADKHIPGCRKRNKK